MTMRPNGVRPGSVDLTNMHRLAQTKIIERRDMASAGQDRTVEAVARRHAKSWRIRSLDWTPAGAPVAAIINAGRWQGLCPDCGGGEYLNVDEPLFWCCSCANVANGHRPRPVLFPDTAAREAIEAVLLERKGPVLPGGQSARNWEPGETVDLLVADNIAHGDRPVAPLPGGAR